MRKSKAKGKVQKAKGKSEKAGTMRQPPLEWKE
jgi:hypothetical protein